MSKVLCISVRFKDLQPYSQKAFKADTWCGKSFFIPKAAYFGPDPEVQKSEAAWIAEWFMKKQTSGMLFSEKKKAWVDVQTWKTSPVIQIERHVPTPVDTTKTVSVDDSLIR